MEKMLGYSQKPADAKGIVFAKTTGKLLKWEFPRTLCALEKIKEDWKNVEYPGIYMLLARKKIYVGEAKDVYNRLRTHSQTPDKKIEEWDKAVIINDGRSAGLSEFNDAVIRKYIELYLIRLFKANKYMVVSQGEPQNLNPDQQAIINDLTEELNFLLTKNGLITRGIEESGQEEVLSDDLQKLIRKKRMTINRWAAHEAIINSEKTYIRPGSKKEKGWQITFRDRFKDALQKGKGYLMVPRGPVLYIPFKEIKRVITDVSKYNQNTIDIYINFKDEKNELSYMDNTIDISRFALGRGVD